MRADSRDGAGPVGRTRLRGGAGGGWGRAEAESEGAWPRGPGFRVVSGPALCAEGAGAAAAAGLTWRFGVSGRGQLRDWGATGRAGPGLRALGGGGGIKPATGSM